MSGSKSKAIRAIARALIEQRPQEELTLIINGHGITKLPTRREMRRAVVLVTEEKLKNG